MKRLFSLLIIFVFVLFAINFYPLKSIEKFTLTSGHIKISQGNKKLKFNNGLQLNTTSLTAANKFTCISDSDGTYWLKFNNKYINYNPYNNTYTLGESNNFNDYGDYGDRIYPISVSLENNNIIIQIKTRKIMDGHVMPFGSYYNLKINTDNALEWKHNSTDINTNHSSYLFTGTNV